MQQPALANRKLAANKKRQPLFCKALKIFDMKRLSKLVKNLALCHEHHDRGESSRRASSRHGSAPPRLSERPATTNKLHSIDETVLTPVLPFLNARSLALLQTTSKKFKEEVSTIVQKAHTEFSKIISNINYEDPNSFNVKTISYIEEAIDQGKVIHLNLSSDADNKNCLNIFNTARILVCGADPNYNSRITKKINHIAFGIIQLLENISPPHPNQAPKVVYESQFRFYELLRQTVFLLRGVGNWNFLIQKNSQNERTRHSIEALMSGHMIAQRMVEIAMKHGELAMEALIKYAVSFPEGVFSGDLYLQYMLLRLHPQLQDANGKNVAVEHFKNKSTLAPFNTPGTVRARSPNASLAGSVLASTLALGDDHMAVKILAREGLANVVLAAHGASREEFQKLNSSFYTPNPSSLFNNLRIAPLDRAVWD